jgi:ribonuclease D
MLRGMSSSEGGGRPVSDLGSVCVASGDLPDQLAEAFASAGRIGWDVETTGLDWARDRLGTCQLFGDGVGVAVVSIDDRRPTRLMALLEDSVIEKIFHHAPFDLRFMVHAGGVRPASIRCTKVASKLLDPDAPNDAHSLQQLVSGHLGVTMGKGPVRTSNWAATPLTAEQLQYAAGDVLHLPGLLDALQLRLQAAGLAELYDACCAFLPGRVALDLGGYPDVFAY